MQSGESQAFALLIGLEAVFLLRNKFACPTSAAGHFETKSDAYRYASIGLILLQELTFWRARQGSAREARAPFHAAPIIDAHPQRMDDAFVGLAFEALRDAWPCRKAPGPPP